MQNKECCKKSEDIGYLIDGFRQTDHLKVVKSTQSRYKNIWVRHRSLSPTKQILPHLKPYETACKVNRSPNLYIVT